MTKELSPLEGYEDFLVDLKKRIRHAQLRAVLSVNRELILLYWQIGRDILNRQQQHGWILVHQIESGLFHRQGKAITNFDRTLPKPQSELAEQLLKEPYCFDFISLEEKTTESNL